MIWPAIIIQNLKKPKSKLSKHPKLVLLEGAQGKFNKLVQTNLLLSLHRERQINAFAKAAQ